MRHVLLLGAMATGAFGMGQTTSAARLITPASGALAVPPGLPRTIAGAVDLATVAAAADKHLSLAADAQE